MAKTKVKTKKRRLVNVDELNAYKKAYEEPLSTRDYAVYVLVPGIIAAGYSIILLYYWWFSIIMFVVGLLYGAKFFLPKSIEKKYEMHSFQERNKFINNMTQILTDSTKTVTRGLATAAERAGGEFREDLLVLQAQLMGADNNQIRDAFLELAEKYEDDVIFVQYLEQMETTMLEGRTNIDTLKDIKTYHNDIKKKQEKYQKLKTGHMKDMRMLAGVIVVFILAIAFSFGFSTYIDAFARTPIGWIAVGIYLTLMVHFFRRFSVFLFDESVMEVKK